MRFTSWFVAMSVSLALIACSIAALLFFDTRLGVPAPYSVLTAPVAAVGAALVLTLALGRRPSSEVQAERALFQRAAPARRTTEPRIDLDLVLLFAPAQPVQETHHETVH